MERKLLYKTRVGSHLYGLNRPESDEDYMGIFMPTVDDLLGLKKVEEVDNSTKSSSSERRNTAGDVDDKSYSLHKFMHLLLQNNPNIVEVLFATPENILVDSPEFRELRANTEKLISLKVLHTFTGYAFSQKKKLTVKSERYGSLVEAVDKMEKRFNGQELADPKRALTEDESDMLNKELKYYKGQKGNTESFHKGMPLKTIYEKLVEERDNYGWRVKTDTFEALGYDCYREDTEFLTEKGWKKYSDITNERLATINQKTLSLEFQNFTDRKIMPFNGELYNIENMFTKCSVTPNHKMFVSQCHRGINGYKYSSDLAKWELKPVEELDNGKFSYFHLLNSAKNHNTDYDIPDWYLKLLGAYVSEGTIIFRKDKIKCVRIGQTEKGKKDFFKMMEEISKEAPIREYKGKRIGTTKNKPKIDYTWWHTSKDVTDKLYADCGHLSKNKTLSNWTIKLSKRQALILLNSMILGDGTERKHCYCYKTISKELANWVQILAFLSEKNTNIKTFFYPSNKNVIYHVYISKDDSSPKATYFNTSLKRKWKYRRKTKSNRGLAGGQKELYNGNVCCFTTPNSTLVTRLDGKIAIQGNCKFGYHLVRILAEGHELLTTGKLTYPIRGEAREDIIRVRNGEVELKELYELYNKWDERCKNAKGPLRVKPDFNWAHKWTVENTFNSLKREA